jgi:hypothetical protein
VEEEEEEIEKQESRSKVSQVDKSVSEDEENTFSKERNNCSI